MSAYERSFSFASFQANQPSKPLPGQRVDIELDAVGAALLSKAEVADLAALADRFNRLGPGGVTKETLGLGNVDDTSDAQKIASGPIAQALLGKVSTNALATALAAKADAGALGSAAFRTAGIGPGNVVVLDSSGRLPALDGSQLVNLPGGTGGGSVAWSAVTGKPAFGTAAAKDVGTGAGNVVALDGSGRLPAVDGSLLTNLPS